MEKFGLFDLLEKFSAGAQVKQPPAARENQSATPVGSEDISGTPPQLKMNDKLRDFILRHDAAVAAVKAANANKKREIKKTEKLKAGEKKEKREANAKVIKEKTPPAAPAKKRGRPKKMTTTEKLAESVAPGKAKDLGKSEKTAAEKTSGGKNKRGRPKKYADVKSL